MSEIHYGKCEKCGHMGGLNNNLVCLDCVDEKKLLSLKVKNENKALQQENQKLRECVEFYASIGNWCVWKTVKGITQYITRSPMDDCTKHNDCGYKLVLAGKRARQCLEEITKGTGKTI